MLKSSHLVMYFGNNFGKKAPIYSKSPAKAIDLAEAQGFEPWMQFKPHTPLAGEPLQPLGHASGTNFYNEAKFITSHSLVGRASV